MTRRSFFSSIAAAFVAAVVPKPKPSPLAFHPDGFSMALERPTRVDVLYGYGYLADPNTHAHRISPEHSQHTHIAPSFEEFR